MFKHYITNNSDIQESNNNSLDNVPFKLKTSLIKIYFIRFKVYKNVSFTILDIFLFC